MIVNLISGVDKNSNGIGCNGGIPWKNKEDMKWFKEMTNGNACIMGWTTFISLKKPLENRLNIVISPDSDATKHFVGCDSDNVRNARSLDEAIAIADDEKYEIAFVIGGSSIYRQYLEKDMIDTMYIDFIDNSDEKLEFDSFFPFESAFGDEDVKHSRYWHVTDLGVSDTGKNFYTAIHRKRAENGVDSKYLDLLNKIKSEGQIKHTRAGDTVSIFGNTLRFDAFLKLPILTTKKIYIKGCIHELLWFIKGDTNIKYLIENNVHIWDDDAYRHYRMKAEKVGMNPCSKDEFLHGVMNGCVIGDYTYGDLGPVYGKQWTDWNGTNQLDELIHKLKTDFDDRRLMINSWNVGELKDMALPPCHFNSQWYATRLNDEQKKMYEEKYGKESPEYGLSVMWSQRSVDTCLGLPYDLLSYSIFLYLVAQCVDMVPLEVICNLGDTHIYENQIESMYQQLVRNPYLFELPHVELNRDVKDIYYFTYDDIKVKDYESYPAVKYKLSVGL